MNFVGVRDSVSEADVITVSYHLDDYRANSSAVRNEFCEEMRKIARWMSRTKIKNKQRINRLLMGELIIAFHKVAYESFTTRDPINDYNKRRENQIFLLRQQNDFATPFNMAEKPHKGRIILLRGADTALYIPHPDSLIPLELTNDSIKNIRGPVGRRIKSAFYQGMANLCTGRTAKAQIQREGSVTELDHHDIVLHDAENRIKHKSRFYHRSYAHS